MVVQKIHSGSELTFLKASEAHLSRMPLVSRHLFSSKLLALMQFLKVFKSDWQNLSKILCLGEPSSSLGKLYSIVIIRVKDGHVLDNSFIDKGGLLLGTTEHVDHIFHWHFFLCAFNKIIIIKSYL